MYLAFPSSAPETGYCCPGKRWTGSRSTGGFCVTSPGLLAGSKLAHILTDCPGLAGDELGEGEFIRYKGRGYAWAPVSPREW